MLATAFGREDSVEQDEPNVQNVVAPVTADQ